ncbi:hypothetical protein T4B_11479 [Trichinella pseudospiralis]|uniref:Uncharacterized protein n=1 Tax=Trichinella pseudospiralis TaxID=6337 RepID=A0A0V1G8X5_TRIPS|nr:hypothetical protein T4B_11479 [Trichinella pseudospiralis]KRY98365.1 hypothetical protein T4C_5183 [Trichinella pseudospiralis]KRZ08052.1 hypothetical protein T4C_855 [Trichinella pseudospiralis]
MHNCGKTADFAISLHKIVSKKLEMFLGKRNGYI